MDEPTAWRRLALLSAAAFLLADILLLYVADFIWVRINLHSTLQWNWFGKILSIIFSCCVLACSPWLRKNVGLSWRQSAGSAKLSIGCFVVFLGIAISGGLAMPPTAFSAETLAYQFFIPGIDEELIFRGILLALLEAAFGQSPMSCRLRFEYASLITSLIFGVTHAMSLDDGRFQFSIAVFLTITVWASIVALVRTRSGSLLWPIILHGVWNGSIFL